MPLAYADDASITDEEQLLRRVPPRWIVPDANNAGRRRVSSAAFDDPEMSVDLASVREALGEPLTTCLAGHEGFSIVSLLAGVVRERNQAVCRDPLPDNPAHGLVVGRKTVSIKKHFSTHCIWIVGPG
jgi:hypothetical protein